MFVLHFLQFDPTMTIDEQLSFWHGCAIEPSSNRESLLSWPHSGQAEVNIFTFDSTSSFDASTPLSSKSSCSAERAAFVCIVAVTPSIR